MKKRHLRSVLYRGCNAGRRTYQGALREAAAFVACSPDRAERILTDKLWRYLRYCRKYSRYWRERWPREAEAFSPAEVRDVLAILPAIGKEELRESGEDLHIRPVARSRGDGFAATGRQYQTASGGSTGVPTVVWQDVHWAETNRAALDFAYRQAGLEPGRPTFWLWGSNNELSDIRKSVRTRASTWLRGLILMPAFALNASKMDAILGRINARGDVEDAICFASAVDTLTQYVERHGREVRRLRRVYTGGGTVWSELRERILRTMADEVYDLYGSRDLGVMAMETTAHRGLAALQWHNYLEVLDERLQRCAPGQSGAVHVTALDNYSTALIRAETGDVAMLGEVGSCGWHAPVLRRLTGRLAEHLLAPDGSRIDPSAVIHMIGVLLRPRWLRRFQLVQRGPREFVLRMETWRAVGEQESQQLAAQVRSGLSRLCRQAVELQPRVVKEIPPSPSGKHVYCVAAWSPDKNT